ncbi:MAG: HAD-IB family phosphatase [Chloroflexi bacterium]|nr:HAD-IB family phosphatase [Chloroflexota bacterium]
MIVQCDFDGTIIANNLSLLLRERFAIGDWQKIESDYLRGQLTVEVSNMRQYALIKESRGKLQEFARQNVEVRPGFLEFAERCREAGDGLVIVSSGLDFYIEAALDEIGASDLELHCARTAFGEDGIIVSYLDPEGSIIEEGFKKKWLARLEGQSDSVTYIGDGLSDLEAACAAARVFATGHLHTLLSAASVAHHTFSDFHDILRQMRRL